MCRDDYVSKMMNILSDKSKFKEVSEDDTESRFHRFKDWLYRHNSLFGDQYDQGLNKKPEGGLNLVFTMD